ncbi:MAG: DUF4097 family beta strand repeat-containing protein [Bacillota bacterium]|nr:DUF4097 family beta strand repeat-containing protein [Bacillota bacterium]
MMNKKAIIALVIGLCLVVVGGVLGVFGYYQGGMESFKTKDSANVQVITSEDIVEERSDDVDAFTGLDIDLDYDFVEVVHGDKYNITMKNQVEKAMPTYSVSDGILTVRSAATDYWLNFQFDSTTSRLESGIIITIPQDAEMADVTIVKDGGKLTLTDLALDNLYIENEYDEISLTDITANTLTVAGTWPAISLNGIKAATADFQDFETMTAENIEGDLWTLETSDSAEDSVVKNANVKDLSIISEYGAITVDGVTGDKLSIDSGNGKTTVSNAAVGVGNITGEYGGISIDGFSGDDLTISNSDGDIAAKGLKLGDLAVTNEYGAANIAESETQKLTAACDEGLTLSGAFLGISDITSEYGDIEMTVNGKEADYGYSLRSEYGNVSVNGDSIEGKLTVRNITGNDITCNSSDGNIVLKFAE